MNVHERTLSVLACKYVDEVIIGAPYVVTEDLIKTNNIGLVVEGSCGERYQVNNNNNNNHTNNNFIAPPDEGERFDWSGDRYEYPKRVGMYAKLPSPSKMTTSEIIKRIVANRKAYEERNRKKVASEAKYHNQKEFVAEM